MVVTFYLAITVEGMVLNVPGFLAGLFHSALCSEHLSLLQSPCMPPVTCLSSTSLVPLGGGRAATALLILRLYEVQSNGNHQNRSVLAL